MNIKKKIDPTTENQTTDEEGMNQTKLQETDVDVMCTLILGIIIIRLIISLVPILSFMHSIMNMRDHLCLNLHLLEPLFHTKVNPLKSFALLKFSLKLHHDMSGRNRDSLVQLIKCMCIRSSYPLLFFC
jgi:hypothetical protein